MRPPRLSRLILTTLGTAIVFLLVLTLVVPGLIGLLVAREYPQALAAVELPGAAEMQVVEFERGWFSSRLRIRLSLGACHGHDCGVTFDNVIHHGLLSGGQGRASDPGLVLATVETRFDLGELLGNVQVQPLPPSLVVFSHLSLTGDIKAHAALPGMTLRLAGSNGAVRLETAPLSAKLRIPLHSRPVVNMTWPRVSLVTNHGGRLAFQGLHVHFVGGTKGWRSYLFAVDKFRYATAGGDKAILYGLRVDAVAHGGGSNLALRLSSLSLNQHEYGPFLVRGHLQLGSGSVMPPLPALMQALAVNVSPAVVALHRKPRLDLERILLGTPYGSVSGTLQVRVSAETEPGNGVLAALEGKADLLVPADLVQRLAAAVMQRRRSAQPPPSPQRVEQAIQDWRQRGLIIYRDGYNAYAIKVKLDGRDLVVNGHRLNNWPGLLKRVALDHK